MTFDASLNIGSLLTAGSVLLSAAALGYGWHKDRQLRRQQYADAIRATAAHTASALQRWQILARQTMFDVQPAALEAARLAAAGDRDTARHHLRTAVHEQRARSTQRIADERLEDAYTDLYGYDPRIQQLFVGAVARLAEVDRQSYRLAREELDALLRDAPDGLSAAELGDRLCGRCDAYATAYADATNGTVDGFRAEVLKLVLSPDERIIARQVPLAAPDDVLPDPVYAVGPES